MRRGVIPLLLTTGLLALAGCGNEGTVYITNLGEREVTGCVDDDCATIAPDTTQAKYVVEWTSWFANTKTVTFRAEVVDDPSLVNEREYELQDGEVVYWNVGWLEFARP